VINIRYLYIYIDNTISEQVKDYTFTWILNIKQGQAGYYLVIYPIVGPKVLGVTWDKNRSVCTIGSNYKFHMLLKVDKSTSFPIIPSSGPFFEIKDTAGDIIAGPSADQVTAVNITDTSLDFLCMVKNNIGENGITVKGYLILTG
jgi:hypothetical protein